MIKMATTTTTSSLSSERKTRILELLRAAAAKAVSENDPWVTQHQLHLVPAERVIRHLYHPETQSWTTDETIVKIEPAPFTHGAMRFCYRMLKRAQPPQSASNHRFHKFGWESACNYVAKAYQKDGVVDTSEEAKLAVQNDVMLQYEAECWAKKYNDSDPPNKIHFIRAYAIEFPDREGQPWFAVERYITGTDMYGAGYIKHNTNAGFVDTELRRVTPQVFSAHSFYASQGQRLVADIQGVGDLYTDPQVLSCDYRFGEGDMGPRGMALFFKNFRHCSVSDALGIPTFSLSKNELKCQAKYEDDEQTLSSDEASIEDRLNAFQRLDANRIRRSSVLLTPEDLFPVQRRNTMKRSNLSKRDEVSQSVRKSLSITRSPIRLHRTQSDVSEVSLCLSRARSDLSFNHDSFHRKASGELRDRPYKKDVRNKTDFHRSAAVRTISAPMIPTEETRKNLGRVHFQLAVLHGSGRFPEVVPDDDNGNKQQDPLERPAHDVFSVLFHLSYAAALQNAPACLAMARVHAGMDSSVSDLLKLIIPTDFEAAKDLLRRAMASPYPPTAPKAAAGCLLQQILHEEMQHLLAERDQQDQNDMEDEDDSAWPSSANDLVMTQVLFDTIDLIDQAEKESADAIKHKEKASSEKHSVLFHEGDRVEADYAMEGTYYSATVTEVHDEHVTVCYDDDGSSESLLKQHVRFIVPPTATQTTVGGPLSDEEAFGFERGDEHYVLPAYELRGELAQVKERVGELSEASALYEQAADGALNEGKMNTATAWSLKAAELQQD